MHRRPGQLGSASAAAADHGQPVYRNFHEHVPVGESHFSVTLPKSYANIKLPSGDTLHRRFRFTELTATPGFFSQRALLLGADGDGTVEPAEADLSLNFSLGYTCHDTLYFVEGEEGELEESVFDQGNRASTLQVFVEDFNAHHERLIPPGFRRTPVFCRRYLRRRSKVCLWLPITPCEM
jgi:hypothetical protein